jgi:hypothetical protein
MQDLCIRQPVWWEMGAAAGRAVNQPGDGLLFDVCWTGG